MVFIEKVPEFLEELKKLYRASSSGEKKTTVSLTFKKYMPKRNKQISEKLRLKGVTLRQHKPIPDKMKNQGILVRACDGHKRKLTTMIFSKNELKNFENEFQKFFQEFIVKNRNKRLPKKKEEEEVEGEGES